MTGVFSLRGISDRPSGNSIISIEEEAYYMPITAVVEKNAYEAAMENFDLAADALELDHNVRNMINLPNGC